MKFFEILLICLGAFGTFFFFDRMSEAVKVEDSYAMIWDLLFGCISLGLVTFYFI